MPVAELQRFRTKYPQYGDLSDEVLAVRLSQRYPEYADLPEKVKRSRIAEEPNRYNRAQQETEALIADRPSSIRFLRGQEDEQPGMEHPFRTLFSLLGAIPEVAESMVASTGLALQRGSTEGLGEEIRQGFVGKRPAQVGDIARASGVPALQTAAPLLGFMATLGVVPKGVRSRVARQAKQTATSAGRAMVEGTQSVAQAPGKTLDALFPTGRPSTIANPNRARDLTFSRIRQRLLNAPKIASKQFGDELDEVVRLNPGQIVNATEEVLKAQSYRTNPHFATILENSIRQTPMSEVERGIARQVLENPQNAANLSLEQAQLVKRIFSQSVKQKWQQVDPDFLGAHLDMQELYHTLQAKQLRAFPQFQEVSDHYAEALKAFRTVANSLKEGNFEEALLGNFRNRGLVIEQFRQLASPSTLQMIERIQKATTRRAALGRIGIKAAQWGGAGAALGTGAALTSFLRGE